MSYFAIVGFDAENAKPKRQEHLESHIQALKALKDEGRLLVAGPMFQTTANEDYTGSILIIDFSDQTAAEAWFQAEPYFNAGVYQRYTIHPYLDAMPII